MGGLGQIVSMLLKEGHLTDKQIAYALRIQSKLETPRILLKVLKELEYLTDDQVTGTVKRHFTSFRIGDLLVELGHINELQLKTCLESQAKEGTKRKLGEVLVSHNFIREEDLLEILSVQLGIPLVEVEFTDIDPKLISIARAKLFREFMFLPIRREGDHILVAFDDPGDKQAINQAKRIFESNISLAIASKEAITNFIDRFQASSGSLTSDSISGLTATETCECHHYGSPFPWRERHSYGADDGQTQGSLSSGWRLDSPQGLPAGNHTVTHQPHKDNV